MKKIVLAAVFASLVLASCSSYTCPTYSKAAKPVNKEQIQEKNV
jgi:hypothetical protein